MSTSDSEGLAALLQTLRVSTELPQPESTDLLANPLNILRASLASLLTSIVDCQPEDAHKAIQWPNDISNGDLSVTLPRLRPGCKPKELSSDVVNKFPRDHALFEPPLLDGVHLRVFLRLEVVSRLMIPYILDRNMEYGRSTGASCNVGGTQKKAVVEFSSPNITNEIQGKHLRSTIIGACISRVYEAMGWDVKRINYLGDWGKPIALLYVGWKRFGSEAAFQADAVGHILEIHHKVEALFQPEQAASRQARDEAAREGKDEGEAQLDIESQGIFAERNEASKRLEGSDEELIAFWKRIRQAIVDDYQKFYERLGLHFDSYSGESEVQSETMIEVETILKEKQIAEESAGAWMVDMTKLGAKAGHAIIRDRGGNSMYLLRDLAAVFERSRKYSFDKMIYVVASDNSVHFTQMFKILEALDKELAAKVQHVKFSEASKMAATLGKGYKPLAILNHCEEAVKKLPDVDADKSARLGDSEQVFETLATSALLVQELSTRSTSAHSFDTGAMASFKLGSGSDLQYWYAKISSLLAGQTAIAQLSDEDLEALADEDQANLLRILAQYPEVVNTAYYSLEASGVVLYLASVTEQLSECLDEEEGAVDVPPGVAALLEATRIVLENGMKLLGLTPVAEVPPERADSPLAR